MSPQVRAEQTGKRNLCYSQWHRKLPFRVTMIDVDGLEYCQRCRKPLAVIETARDVGQTVKPATVLAALAASAGISAYVLLYTVDEEAERNSQWDRCITQFRMKRAYPNPTEYYIRTPQQVAEFLTGIHDAHSCRPQQQAAT